MPICDWFIWSQGLVPRTVHTNGFESQVAGTILVPATRFIENKKKKQNKKMVCSHDELVPATCCRDSSEGLVPSYVPTFSCDLLSIIPRALNRAVVFKACGKSHLYYRSLLPYLRLGALFNTSPQHFPTL